MRHPVDELLKIYTELVAADLEQACVGMWADIFCRRLIVDADPDGPMCDYLQGVLRGMWRLMEKMMADGRAETADSNDVLLAAAAERVSTGVLNWFAHDFLRHGCGAESDDEDETAEEARAARKAIFMDAIGDENVALMEQWLRTARAETDAPAARRPVAAR